MRFPNAGAGFGDLALLLNEILVACQGAGTASAHTGVHLRPAPMILGPTLMPGPYALVPPNSSPTIARSSFNSFTVALIFERLNSLMGTP